MGGKHVSEVSAESQFAGSVRDLINLFDLHLNNFQVNLADFSEARFGISTPRAMVAAESMYFESVVDEAKSVLSRTHAPISVAHREQLTTTVIQRLLIDQHIGALCHFCQDPLFAPSPKIIKALQPLAEFTIESVVRHDSLLFVGDVMRILCPSFSSSERYENAVHARLREELDSGSLGSVADVLSEIPIPNLVLRALRPEIEEHALRHIASRCHPEPVAAIVQKLDTPSLFHSPEGLAALETSLCKGLQQGDMQFLLDVMQELVAKQLVTFEQVLTPRVRQAAAESLKRAKIEREYFQAFSETPESTSSARGALSNQIWTVTRLLSVTRPPALARGKILRGGLSSVPPAA